MSTKNRYARIVYKGLLKCHQEAVGFASVGEVAKAAGVSRPTAAKYLDMFAEDMTVECMDLSKRKYLKANRKFYRAVEA